MTAQILKATRRFTAKSFVDYLKRAYELEKLKADIRKEREELKGLSESELRDIGITRSQALKEAARSFDDIPASRTPGCK